MALASALVMSSRRIQGHDVEFGRQTGRRAWNLKKIKFFDGYRGALMTMFLKENALAFHCVGWNYTEKFDTAQWRYFSKRDECKAHAQYLYEIGAPNIFIWMVERGAYFNYVGTREEDWMYWWWTQNSEGGLLPEPGIGVPHSKSWSYRVPYQPLDPASRPTNL
jgi:hypothetical protein